MEITNRPRRLNFDRVHNICLISIIFVYPFRQNARFDQIGKMENEVVGMILPSKSMSLYEDSQSLSRWF